jgi:hypothetical protein
VYYTKTTTEAAPTEVENGFFPFIFIFSFFQRPPVAGRNKNFHYGGQGCIKYLN